MFKNFFNIKIITVNLDKICICFNNPTQITIMKTFSDVSRLHDAFHFIGSEQLDQPIPH
jgi:hypothetical protein